MNDFAIYWSDKSFSGHRYNTPAFYKRKAKEHVSILTNEEVSLKIVDLGCGAGELLSELVNQCNIVEAVDYSPSMIEVVKKSMPNSNVRLIVSDVKKYIENTKCEVWFACESINQYLKVQEMEYIFDCFVKSSSAVSMFLFDTIDPDKYQLWKQGRGCYNGFFPSRKEIIKLNLKELIGVMTGKYKREMLPIGEMGYAYRPHFWMRLAKDHNVELSFISSQSYEYRYHVILRKIN